MGSSSGIKLNPDHGSLECNVKAHLQSRQHTAAEKDGKKQSTFDLFLGSGARVSSTKSPAK